MTHLNKIIDIPMRLIQKNNLSKYHLYNHCKNTLECYYYSKNKKCYIAQYEHEWRNLFLIKNIDNTYINFSIENKNNNYIITINKFLKKFCKYKKKYVIDENNLASSEYCKYSLKNIISEILTILNYSTFEIDSNNITFKISKKIYF
jgi:hypothetical protein